MKVIGIDISKKTFDVSFTDGKQWCHHEFSNNSVGHRRFAQLLSTDDQCVMEASGPYYLPLALYLSGRGYFVCVENPLVIKRFSQMRLIRAKTDKKDARTIAEYAMTNPVKRWTEKSRILIKMQQLMSAIDNLKKQLTMVKNQKSAFLSTSISDAQLISSLTSMEKYLQKQMDKLEARLATYAAQQYKATMDKLLSIPGIGVKAATMLVVLTEDFTKFENHKQLIAYVGLSPRIYQSGTSVKGKGHICKMGSAQARKILYMCSWSAKKYNHGCVQMYERLAARGKHERVIKIALINKLLKQCFAIATSDQLYQKNYQMT